jgi:stage II sporulation protein D
MHSSRDYLGKYAESPVVREIAGRYVYKEGKFFALFSPHYFSCYQPYPICGVLAMVSSIKKILPAYMLLAILGLLSLFAHQGFCAPEGPVVRVNIIPSVSSLRIRVEGGMEIRDMRTKTLLFRGNEAKCSIIGKAFIIGDKRSGVGALSIRGMSQDVLEVNGRKFKGDIRLIKHGESRFSVINGVPLEDYVKGILFHEVSHYWPQEALKAQAVVSRTYALYSLQQNRHQEFDVRGDIFSQVYGGKDSERYRTNDAVEETAGEVLTFQGRIFPAYFHSTCAGHTEDASALWNIDLPPLKGVACGFCQESPRYFWTYRISARELAGRLKHGGYSVEGFDTITVAGNDLSGRVTYVNFISGGKTTKISAVELRRILGPQSLRSTYFEVSLSGREVVFRGKGWGHGVGLCQWGAYFMAKQGYSYTQILQHYYPQSVLSQWGRGEF